MIRWSAVALLMLLALSACSDDGPEVAASTLAVSSNVDVAALLGTPVIEDEILAGFETTHARSEELKASCMAEAGFDYVPVPFQAASAQPVVITETSLGIADQYFGAFRDGYEPLSTNPNDAIVESLSEDQAAAYRQVLFANSPVFDPRLETEESIRDGLDGQSSGVGGCQFDSQRIALAERDQNQDLIDEYNGLRAGLLQTDQRVFRARVEWAQCIAGAGFTYRDESAMREDLNGQAVAVLQDLVVLRDEGLQMVPGQDPPAEAAALIDELYEQEAEVAGAHGVCGQAVDAAIAEVSAEVDEIFLERHS